MIKSPSMSVDHASPSTSVCQAPSGMHNVSMTAASGASQPNGIGKGKIKLPTIQLDNTLSDLYKQTCPSLRDKRIGHIFCGTTCAVDLSPAFPRNKKYVYQDGSFNDASHSEKTDDQVQGSLTPKYLSLVPQRDAFIAGPDPVIFFYVGQSEAEIAHDEAEAERTLAVVDEAQRPGPIFCSGPGDVGRICDEHGIDGLEVKLVVDQIACSTSGTSKMLIDADTLWYLNGKEALAKSGLPTPATDVIEVQAHCPEVHNCCEACVASGGDDIDPACTGERSRWIGEQTMRILTALERKPLPFVFKNQQAFAGAGTFVVTEGAHRHRLIREMTHGGILRRLLCRVTEDNAYLGPGSILLMELVQDPINDIGLTFFVGEDGTPTYLAASEQMIERATSAWIGSKISYPHQEALQKKLSPLMDQIAAFLHKHHYFGPVGADLLETADGDIQIVDLNVRTSGSLCLPLMKRHFTSRGLQCASSLSITTPESREQFCEQWRAALESGELCIVAWYEDRSGGKSLGDVVIGAKDEEGLSEMLAHVRDLTQKITF